MTDLLFGIERSTRYDWLHPARELRIAATLRSRDGTELRFRRRKNKPALTDLSDAPLPDEALLPVIGGLSREVFRRAFGLDAEALRKSADDLKESGGDLGAALFSAASGLRGVSEVKAALEREADTLFAERKSKDRAFYQALARLRGGPKALRDSETRAGDLKALREQSAAHERRRQEIRRAPRRRSRANGPARSLARPRRHPRHRQRGHRLRALGELPASPQGTGAKLLAAHRAGILRRAGPARGRRPARPTRADMEAMPLDDVLIDAAEDVARLTAELGAYRKARTDLPGVDRELEAAARELARLAARLGLPAQTFSPVSRTTPAGRSCPNSSTRGRALELKADAAIADREAQRGALARKKQERGQRNPLRDPRPVRERRAALAGLVRLATQMAEIAPAIDNDATTLERDGLRARSARARPRPRWNSPVSPAATPSRRRRPASRRSIRRCGTRQQALDAPRPNAHTLQAALDELASGGVVPTPELIAALRAERDAHWASLMAALFQDTAALSGAALHGAVAGFERAKQEADRLADAAAHDAQRVAAHADATRRLGRASAASSASRAAARRTRGPAAQGARGLARAAGRAQVSSRLRLTRWSAWRLRVEAMLERLAKLDERRADLARLHDELENAQASFDALVADLGLAPSPGLPIPALAERIDAEIDRLATGLGRGAGFRHPPRRLEFRVAASEAAEAEAAKALDAWRAAFRAALPRLGPARGGDACRSGGRARSLEGSPGQGRTARCVLCGRIAGMKRDSRLFEEAVAALVAGGRAATSPARRPEGALRTVNQRLTTAREAKARRGEAQARLTEAAEAAAAASAVATRAAEQVESLAATAGARPTGNWKPWLARLAERDSLIDALRAKREELARTADGVDEDNPARGAGGLGSGRGRLPAGGPGGRGRANSTMPATTPRR